MNEKIAQMLQQYDFEVQKDYRGRGGIILETNKGIKLLAECMRVDKYYERESVITRQLLETGFDMVDTYFPNKEGQIVSSSVDGRKYIVKNWYGGRECDIANPEDICQCISTLANLHICLTRLVADNRKNEVVMQEVQHQKEADIAETFNKHNKELKMAYNYLKNKKKKCEFEMLAMNNFNIFYNEALRASKMVDNEDVRKRLEISQKTGELCHGNFNYHNVLVGDDSTAVTNFDKYKNNCQIADLYQFMRKILEKYNWDISLAYKMMDEYDKVRTIEDADLEILAALFMYPEKYWKVINYYYNSNKSWIPRKSMEKLESVISQNYLREKFLDTIA